MKKILLISISIISCLFLIDKVSADTHDYVHSDILNSNCNYYYVDYNNVKSLGYEEQLHEIYNMLLEEYNKSYSTQYPYYYLHFVVIDKKNCNQSSEATSIGSIRGFLNLYTDIPTLPLGDGDSVLSSSYNVDSKTYITPSIISGYYYPGLFDKQYNPLSYFTSNFDLINDTDNSYVITGNSNFTINPGDIIKPIFMSDNAFQSGYTEVDLNNYPYIILSLKDYIKTEEFSTINYVKGQYCLTSVYNYGSTEKKDIIEGSKTKRCSLYYDDFTPVRTYILESDLKNNAIYYLKAYDTSKENKVKIDTSVFNIHYITEEDKDNPLITINDKKYTPKSYDELTDTATKSEDENYVDGASEKFSFSDIFSAPLDFLKDIWSSITKVFVLINNFIELLPVPLQYFLYASFMLAIVLGLIKIIL